MYPENTNFFVEAYKDATREPYSYLLIDLTPRTDDRFSVRSKIFLCELGKMETEKIYGIPQSTIKNKLQGQH